MRKKTDTSKKVIEISDIKNTKEFSSVLKKISPKVVINCIGAIKQKNNFNNSSEIIHINSLLPHLLEDACKKVGARMIHFSTDCVYSGKIGNYAEKNEPDADDLYGMSKIKGEIKYKNTLTLRKSTIGFEINDKKGLLEWFLMQKDEISGYTNAIFSGITNLELAKILLFILDKSRNLEGIYHVSSSPIDKYTLLNIIKEKLKLNSIHIKPYEHFKCDRSLDGSFFAKKTGYTVPGWELMIDELINFKKYRIN